jgi:YXWGXW repeat-containing protein
MKTAQNSSRPTGRNRSTAARAAGLGALAFLLCSLSPLRAASVSAEIVVRDAPPEPRAERMIERERPSARHVWVPGYWSWQGSRHTWVAGRWELPPREHAVWVAPRWEHRDNGYVFVAGSWQDGGSAVSVVAPVAMPPAPTPVADEVVVQVAPPPLRREERIARPSPEHHWIDGYWEWRGSKHEWVAGHWEVPPHGHTEWVAPRWERRGNGYVFIRGFWR